MIGGKTTKTVGAQEPMQDLTAGPPSPDKAAMLEFIAGSIRTSIQLVAFIPDGPRNGRWFGNDAEAAAEWACDANARGANCYWTVNICRPGVNRKPKKADIVATRFLHLDIDPARDGSHFDKAAIAQSLIDAPLPPTALLDSGGGLQAFWRHDGQAALELVEALNRSLEAKFNGDPVGNADRLMRLPGSVNWPDAKKRRRGRAATLARMMRPDTGEVHSIEKLVQAYPPIAQPSPATRGGVEIDWGSVAPITADDLGLPANDGLRSLINHPQGNDRSKDTLRFTIEALKRGLSLEQVAGILTNAANMIAAHCLDQDNVKRAVQRALERAWPETEAIRSLAGSPTGLEDDSVDPAPVARWWTLEAMLKHCVFISDGSRVALIDRPRSALQWSDFKLSTAASTMLITAKGKGESDRLIQTKVSEQWLNDPQRLEVETLTFNPAGNTFTISPEDKTALNTWTGFPRHSSPSDWTERAKPFVQHVNWLFGTEADAFLDWLAHIAQNPGQLPTFGFLHIAPAQGMGRGWIAQVLAKVFGERHVAQGFDLVGALKSGFNGELGGKLLTVVDEIDAGGAQWSIAQSLKKIVTETTRSVNTKYGRITIEYNVCRWLVLSNSETALPLEGRDRRFHVARCDDRPKDKRYYSQLYNLQADPKFIASVAELLGQRDISDFNPGSTPPMTAAKRAMIERMQSDDEALLHDIAERWPVALITSREINGLRRHGETVNGRSLAHDLDRAGLRKVCRIKFAGDSAHVYAVRDHMLWIDASPSAVRAEIQRASREEKEAALFADDHETKTDWGIFD